MIDSYSENKENKYSFLNGNNVSKIEINNVTFEIYDMENTILESWNGELGISIVTQSRDEQEIAIEKYIKMKNSCEIQFLTTNATIKRGDKIVYDASSSFNMRIPSLCVYMTANDNYGSISLAQTVDQDVSLRITGEMPYISYIADWLYCAVSVDKDDLLNIPLINEVKCPVNYQNDVVDKVVNVLAAVKEYLDVDKRKQLVEVIHSHYDRIDDRRMVKGLLADTMPENKLCRNVLMNAYDEGILDRLSRSSDIEVFAHTFSKVLVDDHGINPGLAEWAVRFWIEVINGGKDNENDFTQ